MGSGLAEDGRWAYFGSRGTFFADVTGNGRADAIVVNDDTVTVRRSTGNGFGPAKTGRWGRISVRGERSSPTSPVTVALMRSWSTTTPSPCGPQHETENPRVATEAVACHQGRGDLGLRSARRPGVAAGWYLPDPATADNSHSWTGRMLSTPQRAPPALETLGLGPHAGDMEPQGDRRPRRARCSLLASALDRIRPGGTPGRAWISRQRSPAAA